MGRKQMPKGYSRRQRDKQHDRWKYFLRKEKKKIEKQQKGVAVKMPLDHEITTLAEDLREAQHEVAVYKKAWEAEKQLAEAWREENGMLRTKIKDLETTCKVLIGCCVGLLIFAFMVWGL
jgi:chromosome segregation ATPase